MGTASRVTSAAAGAYFGAYAGNWLAEQAAKAEQKDRDVNDGLSKAERKQYAAITADIYEHLLQVRDALAVAGLPEVWGISKEDTKVLLKYLPLLFPVEWAAWQARTGWTK